MHPVLGNRVVLMAAILVGGLFLASTLAARSTLLAPQAGPQAIEPSTLGGGSAAADFPSGTYLNGSFELVAFGG